MNHLDVWEETYSSREWGKYPPEDLIRFLARHIKPSVQHRPKVCELGCGPGTNLWFLQKEGCEIAGIDYSATAIQQAKERLQSEHGCDADTADLHVGVIDKLPWQDNQFDAVVDIFAQTHNYTSVIQDTIAEMLRVLKPGGRCYVKVYGEKSTGFGSGDKLEEKTYTNVSSGVYQNMGVSHFFDEQELNQLYDAFSNLVIDRVFRTDKYRGIEIEELIVQAQK